MIDMAVGVIVGGAFGKIITSLVNDILMPPLGMLIGGMNFSELKWTLTVPEKMQVGTIGAAPATINYGMFIQNVLDFLIIALCIFFVVRLLAKLKKKEEANPATPAADVMLLQEIRDLLKA